MNEAKMKNVAKGDKCDEMAKLLLAKLYERIDISWLMGRRKTYKNDEFGKSVTIIWIFAEPFHKILSCYTPDQRTSVSLSTYNERQK